MAVLQLGGLMNSMFFVDDDAIIGAEVVRTLGSLGFKVEVAPTVESGPSRAETARFDASW
jgi:ActR/RegA family two-component response regulator